MTSGRRPNKKKRGADQTARLRRQVKRLKQRLREEQNKWDEMCPAGHLRRYDKCTLMCDITTITPFESPLDLLPKIPAKDFGMNFEWSNDELIPVIVDARKDKPYPSIIDWGKFVRGFYKTFDIELVEQQTGWWIRYPRAWWLAFMKWAFPPKGDVNDYKLRRKR